MFSRQNFLIYMSLCLNMFFLGSWQMAHAENSSPTEFVSLGKFNSWEAFFLKQNNEVLCWVSSVPVNDKTSEALLLTSMRPHQNVRDEISFHAPASLDEQKNVRVSVDGNMPFKFSSEGEWAWLRSRIDEGRFVLSSKNGSKINVKSAFENGSEKEYIYSLSGYTKAYETSLNKCKEFFQIETNNKK